MFSRKGSYKNEKIIVAWFELIFNHLKNKKMATKNKFVTTSALDYDEKNKKWNRNAPMAIDLPSDDIALGFGHSITRRAFRKMVGDKLLQLKENFKKLPIEQTSVNLETYLKSQKCAVEFGKESILRVLSQENCIGLRFTFCINDKGEESVIVSGLIEEDGKTVMIKREYYKASEINIERDNVAFDEEKGVGLSYKELLDQNKISIDELMNVENEEVKTKLVDGVFGIL